MTNPSQTAHAVVSMLAGEHKISLYTVTGGVVDIPHTGDYDTGAIMAFLRSKITGLAPVELELSDYMVKKVSEINKVLADGGIEITQVINGETVQGIFYPKKPEAMVKIAGEEVRVPGIDNLLRHAKRANKYNPQSVKNFLERMAPVLKDRAHSAEDLMNFIGQSEMPLTNDGRIICYKRVTNTKDPLVFVDSRSRTIKQQVGSRVFMDVEKVDPSRYNSCSNGLHVANQVYMREFSGDVTMIVLVSPEDFIAVPKGENGKARVSSYDVIGIMSSKAHEAISKGYVKDDEGLKKLIAQAIEGTHVQPFEMVHAGQLTLIKITPIEGRRQVSASKAPVSESTMANATSLDADAPSPQVKEDKPRMNVNQVITTMTQEAVKIPEEVLKAFRMLTDGETKAAIGRALGTSDRSVSRWMEKYGYDQWLKAAVDNPPAEDLPKIPVPDDHPPHVPNAETVKALEDSRNGNVIKGSPLKGPTKVEIIRRMYTEAKSSEDYRALINFKKLSKKSWHDLGIDHNEEIIIISKSVEAGTFDLYADHGGKLFSLIKEVRQFMGLGLREAKELVESKGPILSDAPAAQVANFTKILMDIGFVTETVHHGEARKVMKTVPIESSVQNATAPLSKGQQARLLFESKDWPALIQLKKAAKKSWYALDFNGIEIGQIKKATK